MHNPWDILFKCGFADEVLIAEFGLAGREFCIEIDDINALTLQGFRRAVQGGHEPADLAARKGRCDACGQIALAKFFHHRRDAPRGPSNAKVGHPPDTSKQDERKRQQE